MGQVVTIGLDIAKSVFQVHGVNGAGATVLRHRLTRNRDRFAGTPVQHGLARAAEAELFQILRLLPYRVRLGPTRESAAVTEVE